MISSLEPPYVAMDNLKAINTNNIHYAVPQILSTVATHNCTLLCNSLLFFPISYAERFLFYFARLINSS